MNKKLFIISCFDEYQSRNKFVEQYFVEQGYQVKTFISNFHHQKKEFLKAAPRDNVELIHTVAYSRNFSFARIKNHYLFAKKVANIVKAEKPDVVYANIPPNFVSWYLGKCRKRGFVQKLIFDVYDMWPETMTFGKSSLLLKLPFKLWSFIRNKNINYADLTITACQLHEKILEKQGVENLKTLHLLKEKKLSVDVIPKDYDLSEIKLCYLGSANNIIDIDMICKVISEIKKYKNVHLSFIGSGENKDYFLQRVKEAGCGVTDYAAIYDDNEKEKILLQCHFGLNIMKPQVCVGLTLKSLEYFSCALPIINTIPCDTENLISYYGAGINVDNKPEEVGNMMKLLTSGGLYEMKIKTLKLFNEKLSVSHFNKEFGQIMNTL